MCLIVYLVAFYGFISIATAADNYFQSPVRKHGKDPVLTLGETQLVSWKTSLEVFNVSIWQQSRYQDGASSQGNVYSKIHAKDQVTNFTWAVQLYDFDLDYSNLFFFWINPDGPNGFTSAFFNISEPSSTSNASADTSTSTNTSPTSTSSSSSSSSSSEPSSHSDASSESDSSSESTESDGSPFELTTTAKIAIAVGAGLGVPILCALGVLIWLKKRQSNQKQAPISAPTDVVISWPEMQKQQEQSSVRPVSTRHPLSAPKEVHGNDLPGYCSELPSQGWR